MEVRLTPAEHKAAQQAEAQREMLSCPTQTFEVIDVRFAPRPAMPLVARIGGHIVQLGITFEEARIGPGPDRPVAHQ
jgi:hypothetical protein